MVWYWWGKVNEGSEVVDWEHCYVGVMFMAVGTEFVGVNDGGVAAERADESVCG